MKEDVILLLRIIEFVSFGPVVTDGVGKNLTIMIEATSCNGLFHLLRCLELGTGVFVPE